MDINWISPTAMSLGRGGGGGEMASIISSRSRLQIPYNVLFYYTNKPCDYRENPDAPCKPVETFLCFSSYSHNI